MLIVPVRAVPNQVLTCQLSGQPTLIHLRQLDTGLYMDVFLNDALIVAGVLCLQSIAVIRTSYLGYVGDFALFDNQPDPLAGPQDPDYTGLGSRWPLYYFEPSELLNINEI